MKQMMPFLLIVVIVAGALIFLRDDYEESFDPDLSHEITTEHWRATLFMNDWDTEEAQLGLKLEYINEEADSEGFEMVEFFVESVDLPVDGVFYQDLELEAFDGTVVYEQPCEECAELEGGSVGAFVRVNWLNEETFTEQFEFQLQLDE